MTKKKEFENLTQIDDVALAEIMADYRAVVEKNLKLEKIAKQARIYLVAAVHGDLIEVEKTMFALNDALNEIFLGLSELTRK